MKSFKNKQPQQLIKAVLGEYPEINFGTLNKLLRKKDIKINGKRVSANVDLQQGDLVEVYYDFDKASLDIPIVYQDDNVVIVNKPQGIEVVSKDNDLTTKLSLQLGQKVYPAHRIDLNTSGLVIFAKSNKILKLLEEAFVQKYLDKYYLAVLKGVMAKKEGILKAFLFKDVKKSQVFIYDTHKPNTKNIETHYKVVKELEDASLVEIKIPTGRTHQIRAHMNYIGHPVVGDQKYGDVNFNKQYNTKRQWLCAYKLVFKMPNGHILNYLNDKSIIIEPDFLNKI